MDLSLLAVEKEAFEGASEGAGAEEGAVEVAAASEGAEAEEDVVASKAAERSQLSPIGMKVRPF